MRSAFIETLHCPFTGSGFTVSVDTHERRPDIDYGVLSSEAGDFPIIDGILRLKLDEYRRPLVNLIKDGRPAQALLTALEMPSYSRASFVMDLLNRSAHKLGLDVLTRSMTALKRPLYRTLTNSRLNLTETLKHLPSDSWANWQIFRFSMPTFLSTYPLVHLIQGHGPVLDLGSGAGHASFLISRHVPASNITCADYQFSALYLAKKYFVSDANFVCLDGNYLLPFESTYFSSVFSSDVLHLIDSKLSLSREFTRVVSDSGVIILPHLHNKLSPIQFGKSLTPGGYSILFNGTYKRVVPEDWIIQEFINNDSLDLDKEWTNAELAKAIIGVSLVSSKNVSLFRRYSGVFQKYANEMENPAVNPAYGVSGKPGSWVLKKDIPTSQGLKSAAADDAYLPNTVALHLPALDKRAVLNFKMSEPAAFAELARKFIFIEVPDRFQ